MDRNKAKLLREKLDEVLKAFIGPELGVSATVGRGSFTESNLTFKIEIADLVGGVAVTKEASAFKVLAPLYGVKPEDLGRTFTFRGEQYELTGLNSRADKFPFKAKRVSDGRGFKFGEEIVKQGLGYAVKPSCGPTVHQSLEALLAS